MKAMPTLRWARLNNMLWRTHKRHVDNEEEAKGDLAKRQDTDSTTTVEETATRDSGSAASSSSSPSSATSSTSPETTVLDDDSSTSASSSQGGTATPSASSPGTRTTRTANASVSSSSSSSTSSSPSPSSVSPSTATTGFVTSTTQAAGSSPLATLSVTPSNNAALSASTAQPTGSDSSAAVGSTSGSNRQAIIAGASVGAVAGVAFIVLLFIFWYKRRSRQRQGISGVEAVGARTHQRMESDASSFAIAAPQPPYLKSKEWDFEKSFARPMSNPPKRPSMNPLRLNPPNITAIRKNLAARMSRISVLSTFSNRSGCNSPTVPPSGLGSLPMTGSAQSLPAKVFAARTQKLQQGDPWAGSERRSTLPEIRSPLRSSFDDGRASPIGGDEHGGNPVYFEGLRPISPVSALSANFYRGSKSSDRI